MQWTTARDAALRKYWADGLSCSEIAAKIGGFENYDDGGRSAINGRVKRLRDSAQNAAEKEFWTRRKKKFARPQASQRKAVVRHPAFIPHHRLKALIEAPPPVITVKEGEVEKEWAKQMHAAANSAKI